MTPKPSLRLFILGASGGIGRALVEQALQRGHQVTAFVRSSAKLAPLSSRIDIQIGNPLDEAELVRCLPDHDVVLSALGPPGTGKTTLHRDAMTSTIAAMKRTGARRIVAVSAAVLFRDQGFVVWLMRNTFLKNIAEDTQGMENLLAESNLDWTVARPPRLTNGAFTGRYGAADEDLPQGGTQHEPVRCRCVHVGRMRIAPAPSKDRRAGGTKKLTINLIGRFGSHLAALGLGGGRIAG